MPFARESITNISGVRSFISPEIMEAYSKAIFSELIIAMFFGTISPKIRITTVRMAVAIPTVK